MQYSVCTLMAASLFLLSSLAEAGDEKNSPRIYCEDDIGRNGSVAYSPSIQKCYDIAMDRLERTGCKIGMLIQEGTTIEEIEDGNSKTGGEIKQIGDEGIRITGIQITPNCRVPGIDRSGVYSKCDYRTEFLRAIEPSFKSDDGKNQMKNFRFLATPRSEEGLNTICINK